MKPLLLISLIFPAWSLAALTDFISDSNGKRIMLSQAQAMAHCKSLGMKLPAPRVYAEEMVAIGKGFIEPTKYPDHAYTDSYVSVERQWLEGQGYQAFMKTVDGKTVIDFYYRHYNWPPVVNYDWAWTSATYKTVPDYYPPKSILFNMNSKKGFEPDAAHNRRSFKCEIL